MAGYRSLALPECWDAAMDLTLAPCAHIPSGLRAQDESQTRWSFAETYATCAAPADDRVAAHAGVDVHTRAVQPDIR